MLNYRSHLAVAFMSALVVLAPAFADPVPTEGVLIKGGGLAAVLKMRPAIFATGDASDANATRPQFGLLAPDLAAIDDRFVIIGADGHLADYRPRAVVATLVQAIHEIEAERKKSSAALDVIAARLSALEGRCTSPTGPDRAIWRAAAN